MVVVVCVCGVGVVWVGASDQLVRWVSGPVAIELMCSTSQGKDTFARSATRWMTRGEGRGLTRRLLLLP